MPSTHPPSSVRAQTINLVQMIVQGRWLHESTFLNLPHATPRLVATLQRHRVECLPELVAAPVAQRRAWLADAAMSERQIRDVESVLQKLPLIDVVCAAPPAPLAPGARVAIGITLARANAGAANARASKVLRAYTPFFPKPKEEGWWLLVAHRATAALVSLRRCPMGHGRARAEAAFEAPLACGVHAYDVYLMSDCYLGLDQQYAFEITVQTP